MSLNIHNLVFQTYRPVANELKPRTVKFPGVYISHQAKKI